MKIYKKILCAFAAISALTIFGGCSTSYLSQPSSDLKINTIGTLNADIEVGDKIEAVATVSRICYIFISGPSKFAEGVNYGDAYKEYPTENSFWGDTVAEAKAAAAYKACVENKADFIICPRYYIIIDSYPFYKSAKVKVFGYKGVLKGVHIPKQKQPTVRPVEVVNPIEIDKPIKLIQSAAQENVLLPRKPIEDTARNTLTDTTTKTTNS